MKLSFETAFIHLKQGKKISRAYWPEGIYIRKREMGSGAEAYLDVEEVIVDEDGEHSLFDGVGDEPWFCTSDLFETDWEVMK